MGRFRVNPLGIKALGSTKVNKDMQMRAAREVATYAKSISPVRTGAYRRSIKPTVVYEGGMWIGRVNAWDFKAYWVEYGTNGITKSRVLGTSLDVVAGKTWRWGY